MPQRGRVLALAAVALLLGALPLVAAHGDEHDAGGDVEASKPPAPSHDDGPKSYWSLTEHTGLMYMHIATEVLAWFVVLPVGVMFSIARSRFALPTQFAFLAVNALALLLGVAYNKQTPDLYDNSSHAKIGWIVTWIASAWVGMALIQVYAGRTNARSVNDEAAQPMTAANMAHYERVYDEQLRDPDRFSSDSGPGTSTLCGHSRSPSVESENHKFPGPTRRYTDDSEDGFEGAAEKHGYFHNSRLDRFCARCLSRFVAGRPLKWLRLFYVVLDRTMLLQGFVAFTTGTVVYGGIARGGAVFNVLAHYIKGAIFFWYGLLTLGRWMGAFADFGWAWNVKPGQHIVGRRRAALPSAEFTESFVIFLYGCTNVFLEHLAAWGDAWAPQDLEHVSISVMFFGGGLLGMLIESRKMRELLNTSVLMAQPHNAQYAEESWEQPRQYNFSMNPMPALIILLLGKMMSAHHQASMLSTMIHTQWGSMFMGFALARAVTYITLYIRPPTSFLPSRPPTEIVSAFCLVAGGITFILSNKDTVAAMESYGLDAMFSFTVTMGFTALIMAWTTVLVALKGWAVRKESATRVAKYKAGVLA